MELFETDDRDITAYHQYAIWLRLHNMSRFGGYFSCSVIIIRRLFGTKLNVHIERVWL